MFINGVSVVLCGSEAGYCGATIAWATKVEKTHVVISLPLGAPITDQIATNKHFSINVLGVKQSDVARQYGGNKQANPLKPNRDDLDFHLWKMPVVKDAHARMNCELVETSRINDQLIVIAKILASETDSSVEPLIYRRGDYFDSSPVV